MSLNGSAQVLRNAIVVVAISLTAAGSVAAQTGSILGRVTDAGTSLALFPVYVQVFDGTGTFVTGVATDAAGNYTAAGVPAGTAFARTWNELGYVDELYDNLLCVGYCQERLGAPIPVTSGGTTSGIDFALRRGGQIAGRVVDATSGAGLTGDVFVQVVNAAGFYFASGVTNATGQYLIGTGLPAGEYLLRTTNTLGYVDELYSDVPCFVSSCPTASATPVAVVMGATTTVDFGLSIGGRIGGTITDAAASGGLADAYVQIYNAAGNYVTQAYSDAAGVYLTDQGLPTGTYFAAARSSTGHVGELYDNIICAGFCSATSGTPIAVASGATTGGIDFALGRGGRVAGRITDELTGRPIPQVSVSVVSGTGSWVASGYTDDFGDYVTDEGVPTGTYYVATNNSDGYLNEVYDNVLCIGCSSTVGTAIGVTAGATTSGIDFALRPGGRISGTVTSVTGTPLAGVYLTISNAAGTYITSGYTDSGGRYVSQGGLQTGDYYVSTNNELGFIDESFDDIPCPGYCSVAGTPVAVSLGSTTGAVDFALVAGGRVEGTVRDAGTGLPLPDVSVSIIDPSGSYVSNGSTDSLGRYRSGRGLPSGSFYAQTYNSTGYIDELYANIPCAGGGCPVSIGTPFAVTLGATTTGINFGLDRGGRITGVVQDALTGTPLANVTVQASDGSGIFLSSRTDALGRYAVVGLPAGTYYLRTFNTVGYLDELHLDIPCFAGCPLTTGVAVPLALGGTVSGIDFALNRGGRARGVVTDAASGLPLAGVRVNLVDASGRSVAGGTTDIAGAYLTGAGVPTGTYFALTSNSLGFIDELYDDVACVGGCSLAGGVTLALTAGATRSGVDFALEAGGRIAGTVTDTATGAPLGDVSLSVYDASGRFVTSAYTDGAGAYLTGGGLPAGSYFVQTRNFAGFVDELYDNRYCAGGSCTPVTGTPVPVATGSTTGGIDFDLLRGGRIAGRVIDGSTLLPIASVSVSFVDASGRFVASGFSDAQGRYQTDTGLLPGTYFAYTRNGLGYINRLYDGLPCPGSCNPTTGTPIPVMGEATTPNVNFVLLPGGRVSGTVTDGGTAAPLAGVAVNIYDGSGAFVTSGSTNSAGFYITRDGLPTGSNYFARTTNGMGYVNGLYAGLPCVGSCTVTAGTPIVVTVGSTTGGIAFALSRGARVSGEVKERTGGEPLPNVTVALHNAAGALVARTTTDGLGSYLTREGVPGGTYFARTENSQGYVDQVYAGIDCLAGCNPTAGTALALVAGATRNGVDFSLALDTDQDGDGIAATIDRDLLTAADESALVSSDFNDTTLGGTTAGTITSRGGFTVRVGDVSPGGVHATALGSGTGPAILSVCATTGPEGVVLDAAGELTDVSCSSTGSATVRALVATPAVQLRKPVTGPATVVDLTTGQAATLGSPVVASPGNTEAILVRFVDGAGFTFGSLELDAGESVDTTVLGPDTVQVTVLSGVTTVTVGGETATLRAGDSRTFGSLSGGIDALVTRIDVLVAEKKIRNRGIGQVLKIPLQKARGLVGTHAAAAAKALEWELVLLHVFTWARQIHPAVRDEFRPIIEALIAGLS